MKLYPDRFYVIRKCFDIRNYWGLQDTYVIYPSLLCEAKIW